MTPQPPAPDAVEALRELVAARRDEQKDVMTNKEYSEWCARYDAAWAAARAVLQSLPAGGEG